MRSGKKRQFRISESEESEQQESEQQTSSPRPTRSRNAPQRFTSSSYPTTRRVRSGMPRKPRKARHAAAVTRSASRKEKKLEGEMERCEEEEEFVSSYAYDHIGQAIREEFPTVWVDVPVVDLTRKPSPLPSTEESTLEQEPRENGKHDEGEVAQTVLSQRDLLAIWQYAKKQAERLRMKKANVEDQRPTQDSVEIERAEHARSDTEAYPKEASDTIIQPAITQEKPQQDSEVAKESRVEDDMDAPATDVALPSRSPSPPLTFVDAVEDVAHTSNSPMVEVTLPAVYHPETALSHGVDEQSEHRFRASSKKGEKGKGHAALFLGSDDEDDETRASSRQLSEIRRGTTKSWVPASKVVKGMTLDKVVSDSTPSAVSKPREAAEAGPSRLKSSQVAAIKTNSKTMVDSSILEARKKRKKKVDKMKKKKSHHQRDSDDDLAQNLNVDAFARSTSNKERDAKRLKDLARLRRQKLRNARKRRGEVSSSEPSSSSSSSSESESSEEESSIESVGSDFIVQDDGPTPTRNVLHKAKGTVAKRRRSLSPPSLVSKDYLSDVRSLGRRERLQEYIRWIVVFVKELEVGANRKYQLEAVRTLLREKFRAEYNSLTSQANRRQFTWYLKHYPYFERRPMTKEEKEKFVGCSACHKTTQKCVYAYTCWGFLYNHETFEIKEDYSSSDMSSEADDWKQDGKNESNEKVYTFYLGESCAKQAGLKHKLHHWERRVLGEIIKLPVYKALKKKTEPIGTNDIEAVVNAYYPKLSSRFAKLETEAESLRSHPERVNRIRERWDDDP